MTPEQTAAAPDTLLASPDQVGQAEITEEIRQIHADAASRVAAGEEVPSQYGGLRGRLGTNSSSTRSPYMAPMATRWSSQATVALR